MDNRERLERAQRMRVGAWRKAVGGSKTAWHLTGDYVPSFALGAHS